MFWADEISQKIVEALGKDKNLLIRDEKSITGQVHVGSMRGVAIHGAIDEDLTQMGVPHTFKYELNDFDVFDSVPPFLSEAEYSGHIGKLVKDVPGFVEQFGGEFKKVIEDAGYKPEFYWGSELYTSGTMDGVIKEALEHAADIRRIYKEVSGSQKEGQWLPIQVLCETCNKISTTEATEFDGQLVSYGCSCGHKGSVSPYGGKAKLPWKVEWPAKWKVLGVNIEGAGKDHSTKGGARDVANHLAREVFGIEPPFDVPYEFFLVGGRKMSSSKGRGSSAKEIASLVPTKIFRLALIGKEINQQFNFDPEGDTIPILYDHYDKLTESYWTGKKDDYARLFEFIHPDRTTPQQSVLPRFSTVAFVVQMPHLDLSKEFPDADPKELGERGEYAKRWLEAYAPEKYVYKLQDTLPEVSLSDVQKRVLKDLADLIGSSNPSAEEIHQKLHESKEFKPIYQIFLGKDSGPKAGWFLASLPKDMVLKRLRLAAQAGEAAMK